ncbi:MAG: dephospho-CoA kinase [Candidatus Gallimonas sp.]
MKQSKYAVTGGIGSGKTVFCNILREWGYPVYSCDEIYREVLRDGEYLKELSLLFPDCFTGGTPDKKALARRAFSSEENNSALNALAHPRVMKKLFEQAAEDEVFFAEVPLLFEGGYESLFDGVIVLEREKSARVFAVTARDGLTEEEVLARMARQTDEKTYREKKCVVVKNDGDMITLRLKAEEALRMLGLR